MSGQRPGQRLGQRPGRMNERGGFDGFNDLSASTATRDMLTQMEIQKVGSSFLLRCCK